MGVDHNKVEPSNCVGVLYKPQKWNVLKEGGLVPYMEKFHGNDHMSTEVFVCGWKKIKISTFKWESTVNEESIAQVTGLSIDCKVGEEALQIFYKNNERRKLIKLRLGHECMSI
ncbi:hypothetical protein SUGI_1092950 [Cryptomeria japonica]|nr:hypothetical protein SUGI_1092950 [Cryptomeria japonica]